MKTLTKATCAALLLLLPQLSFASSEGSAKQKRAEKVEKDRRTARDVLSFVGTTAGYAYGGPAGAAAGALAGKRAAESTINVREAVSDAIDRHFDAKDQELADRTGVTISYPDRGVVIEPREPEKDPESDAAQSSEQS